MRRILKIEVSNRDEFEAIKRAIEQPDIMAFLKVIGYLQPLGERQRKRVMTFVADAVQEQE